MKKRKVYEYKEEYCRRKRKYGIRKTGYTGWWIEPIYEAIEELSNRHSGFAWIKKNGRYGCLDIERREEPIPCEYGFPIWFSGSEDSWHIAWKDHKAGVINGKNEVLIPFIYDEIHTRTQYVDNPNPRTYIDLNGEERIIPHERKKAIFKGFACFTNEGGQQAYDERMQPCEFADWEKELLYPEYEWCIPENANRTVEEVEAIIQDEYRQLLSMGYSEKEDYMLAKETRDAIDAQKSKVQDYIIDRRYMLNRSWVHCYENAQKISRMNDLMMRAVAKAIKLGSKASRSLQWMEKVPHKCKYYVDVGVHPLWVNDKSAYNYTPKESVPKKERERLEEQELESRFHIWNIISAISRGCPGKMDGAAMCFSASSNDYNCQEWEFHKLVMDDGQSWDEGLHYPAYMDVYFTVPFYYIYSYCYYANADLININDFRVKINVRLETKEMDRC